MSEFSLGHLAPWLPDETFWQQNSRTIDNILRTIAKYYPDQTPPVLTEEELSHPSTETKTWMWEKLMGHQHGSQQGFGDKLPLLREQEYLFWPDVAELHY